MDSARFQLRNADGSLSEPLTETDLVIGAREGRVSEETQVLDRATGRWRPAWTIEALVDSFGLRIPAEVSVAAAGSSAPSHAPQPQSTPQEPAPPAAPSPERDARDVEVESLLQANQSSGGVTPALRAWLIGGALLMSGTCLGIPVSLFFSAMNLPRPVGTADQQMLLRVPQDWQRESPLPGEELRVTADEGKTSVTVQKTPINAGDTLTLETRAAALAGKFAESLTAAQKREVGPAAFNGRPFVQHEVRWTQDGREMVAYVATTEARGALYQVRAATPASLEERRKLQLQTAIKTFQEDRVSAPPVRSSAGG